MASGDIVLESEPTVYYNVSQGSPSSIVQNATSFTATTTTYVFKTSPVVGGNFTLNEFSLVVSHVRNYSPPNPPEPREAPNIDPSKQYKITVEEV